MEEPNDSIQLLPGRRSYQGWANKAACKEEDPNLFYPERGGSSRPAIKVCRRCPVMLECRTYSIKTGELYGVWGGLNQDQRRRIIRNLRAQKYLSIVREDQSGSSDTTVRGIGLLNDVEHGDPGEDGSSGEDSMPSIGLRPETQDGTGGLEESSTVLRLPVDAQDTGPGGVQERRVESNW